VHRRWQSNFDDHPPVKWSVNGKHTSTEVRANAAQDRSRAIAELLSNKLLIDRLGEHGAYEVRTRLDTRQAWRYRCSVFRHGKEMKKEFAPIDVDLGARMPKGALIVEGAREAFAADAVEHHMARCAAVQEYLLLTSTYAEPVPPHLHRWHVALAAMLCGVVLAAYWFWNHPLLLTKSPVRMVQWTRNVVFYEQPSGTSFTLPLPALEQAPSDGAIAVTLESTGEPLDWLDFDAAALVISGTAPPTAEDRTYRLILRARGADGAESLLHVYFIITGQMARLTSPPRVPEGSPLDRPAPDDCLLKILKGEPCRNQP
jgi:hypothetical protein